MVDGVGGMGAAVGVLLAGGVAVRHAGEMGSQLVVVWRVSKFESLQMV